MDISVIVPLFNEEESLPELFAWIKRVMDTNDFTYEVIFVNDGSTDRSWNVIEELAEKFEQVKGIKFRRNYGKSPALYCGFKEAQGDVVITMDADLQDSPDYQGWLRPRFRLQAEPQAGRPSQQDHPNQAVQCYSPKGKRNP